MRVVLIAGGVGGAKLAFGLSRVLAPDQLTVVVNVGDDFTHLGLRICPDLDTVTYTLAGLDNRDTGWGVRGDTFEALAALTKLGGPAWFRTGDRDLGLHLRRTAMLAEGTRLTDVTKQVSSALGIGATILPATDDMVPTRVDTDEGELDFQDYFVRRRCEPRIIRVIFAGIERAVASREVIAAIEAADGIVIAPSNPFVSVEPVLALGAGGDAAPGQHRSLRDLIALKPAVAVSPIVGGEAIKGPAAKMMRELGLDVAPGSVARRYAGVIRGFVMDDVDAAQASGIAATGLLVRTAQSVMRTDADREALARECLGLLREVGETS